MHINTVGINHSEKTRENTGAIKTQKSNTTKYQYSILLKCIHTEMEQ